jgi:hypothetical protein
MAAISGMPTALTALTALTIADDDNGLADALDGDAVDELLRRRTEPGAPRESIPPDADEPFRSTKTLASGWAFVARQPSRRLIAETLVALANSDGGTLVLGADWRRPCWAQSAQRRGNG